MKSDAFTAWSAPFNAAYDSGRTVIIFCIYY